MKQIILYCFAALLLINCSSRPGLKKKDNLYLDNGIEINSTYYLHHENDSISRLYYCIDNKEIIYKKNINDSMDRANLKLFFKIQPSINSKQFTDSTTVFISDAQLNPKHGYIKGNKIIKVATGTKAYIDIRLVDINRKGSNHEIIAINKISSISNQNYLLKTEDSSLIYTNYVAVNTTISLRNNRISNKIIGVSFYNSYNSLPPPPFSSKELPGYPTVADTGFLINKNMDDRFEWTMKKEGIYFLQTDSNYKQGATFLAVNEDYPKVASHKQMIEAIRYITSKDEYEELLSEPNQKDAIERYWLNAAGSMDRAKGLIKKYYGRVQTANTKFTSYKEGWKTDRGMILIIFGEPQYLYQNEGQEVWVYGTPGTPGALRFEFNRKENPYSDNEYQMVRSMFYKDAWYQAVDAWREGRIYLDN